MKVSTIFLLVLLTAGLCQTFSLKQLEHAITTVPLSLRPTINGRPGVDHDTCGGLWFKHGFICDKRRALAFTKRDKKYIKGGEKTFNKSLKTLAKLAKTLLSSKLKGVHLKESEKADLRSYLNEAYIAKTEEEAATCWNEVIRLRNSALCSVCSGNYRDFYYNHRAIVSLETCSRLTTMCDGHFNSISKMFRVKMTLMKVEHSLNPLKLPFGKLLIKFVFFITKTLSTLIHERENQTTPEDKEKVIAKLCSFYFRVKFKPLLPLSMKVAHGLLKFIRWRINIHVGLHKIHDGIKNTFKNLHNNFKKIGEKLIPKRKRNKKRTSKSRNLEEKVDLSEMKNFSELNSTASLNSIESGDIVVVKNHDNMFTAIDGGLGTTLGQSLNYKPMNLTLIFP